MAPSDSLGSSPSVSTKKEDFSSSNIVRWRNGRRSQPKYVNWYRLPNHWVTKCRFESCPDYNQTHRGYPEVLSYISSMNGTIRIISCEVVEDNWGRTSTLESAKDILEQLIYPIDWTDDVTFLDDQGNAYTIDDLHDRVVEVGDKRFRVDVDDEEVEEMP